MDDQHGLDLMQLVGGKPGFDLGDVGAAAPVGRHEFEVELEFLGDALPQYGELAGLGEQHLVAGRKRVDDGRLPGAGARRRENDHRLFGAENALHARKHGKAELGEFRAPVVQRRHVHGPQDPVRYIGRAWNLKKMPSCMQRHAGRPSRESSVAAVLSYSGLVSQPARAVNAYEWIVLPRAFAAPGGGRPALVEGKSSPPPESSGLPG